MLLLKRLRLALRSVPSIILFCKAYLGTKAIFSTFFLQCPLRMELIWFCPNYIERWDNASWCVFTKMGMRVHLNTLTLQQLSIVWQAKLLLSIINFSRVFVSVFQKLLESFVWAVGRKGWAVWCWISCWPNPLKKWGHRRIVRHRKFLWEWRESSE